jgi:hypothetical protein
MVNDYRMINNSVVLKYSQLPGWGSEEKSECRVQDRNENNNGPF